MAKVTFDDRPVFENGETTVDKDLPMVSRPMTLEEWMNELPSFHPAYKEYQSLKTELEETKVYNRALEKAHAILLMKNNKYEERIAKLTKNQNKTVWGRLTALAHKVDKLWQKIS